MGDPDASPPRTADPDTRARTHLANERTFLAWLRTGLSLVVVGLAAARLLPLDLVPGIHYVTLFSVLLVLVGIVMIAYGAARYDSGCKQIRAGSYQPEVRPILIVAVVVCLLGVMAIPLIFRLR